MSAKHARAVKWRFVAVLATLLCWGSSYPAWATVLELATPIEQSQTGSATKPGDDGAPAPLWLPRAVSGLESSLLPKGTGLMAAPPANLFDIDGFGAVGFGSGPTASR